MIRLGDGNKTGAIEDVQRVAPDGGSALPAMIATVSCIVAYAVLVLLYPRLMHWFAVPVLASGIIVATDACHWLAGRYDVLDPRGLVSFIGCHFFFLAPLLSAAWDARLMTPYVNAIMDDIRPWLGVVATAHFLGLVAFYWAESRACRGVQYRPRQTRVVRPGMPALPLVALIILCFVAQAYLFVKRGGLQTRLSYDEFEVLAGEGPFRMLAMAFPILLMVLVTLPRIQRNAWQASRTIVIILVSMLALWVFFAFGLAGSRSATIWPAFWVIGIAHFMWRRISRLTVILGLAFLFLFAWGYSFYKFGGTEQLGRALDEGFVEVGEATGRGWRQALIGDLSRANVHAQMAWVTLDEPYKYRYRWGWTIVGDVLVQFPRWIWTNSYNGLGNSGKEIAGTELLKGDGSFNPYDPLSHSRFQFGLTGQAILNFGIWSVPVAFAVWGHMVGRLRAWLAAIPPMDVRRLMAPAIINLSILVLVYDFNNLIYFTIFRILLPAIAIWWISTWAGEAAAHE